MLLYGALKKGNTGVVNEISTINDIPLEKGILNSEDLKICMELL